MAFAACLTYLICWGNVLQNKSAQFGWERHSLCRYLFFYSETLELLLRSGVPTPDQTGLSVMSEAICDLWSSLPPERRAEAQQQALDQSPVSWEGQTKISQAYLASLYTSPHPSASHVVEEVRNDAAILGLFWKSFALPLHFQFPSLVTNAYWWHFDSQPTVLCVLSNPWAQTSFSTINFVNVSIAGSASYINRILPPRPHPIWKLFITV